MNELAIQKPSAAGTLVRGTRSQIIVHTTGELISAAKEMGAMLFHARRFNFGSKEEAESHALICLMTGQDIMSCIQEVDAWQTIAGQRQMKFRAMENRFLRVGGKIKLIARTPFLADAELTRDGQTVRASFSWEEAKVEPYVWNKNATLNGGKLAMFLDDGTPNPAALKDNWSTPRRRMQMLWARMVTDTIASIWADIVGGAYIVNEVSDEGADDIIDGEVVQQQPDTPQQAVLPAPQPAPAAPAPIMQAQPPATPQPEPAVQSPPQVSAGGDVPESRREYLLRRLNELYRLLKLNEDKNTWQQLLSRYGVPKASQLTEEQADSLLGTLMERWESKKLEDDAAGFSFSADELAGQTP